MEHRIMTNEHLAAYSAWLRYEERSENTISKYMHELREFSRKTDQNPITKETVLRWKEHLCALGRSAGTVNGALAALHSFFAFMGWTELRVRYLKVQKRLFRDPSRELTKEEYLRLVQTAERKGNRRLALLLETICSVGVRVSEVRYITVEAVQKGRVDISLKGKIRTIFIPGKLARKLQKYAAKQKIVSGEIFITKNEKSMSRRQIWWEMKRLCRETGVAECKVFPHNLRHLFARTFYRISRDIVRLADVLGHSSVETTRIYLITAGDEHIRHLERLGLVL